MNERSFEIWQREKFLIKEQGKKILKRCKIEPEILNVYETTEPLSYYSHTRKTPQNLLIIENKDTFYSMRKHLLNGNDTILGMKIGTLIYGGGKGIFRSFQDFDLCVVPYMKTEENQIYYFGDLDYEGIGIYECLAELFQKRWQRIIELLEDYTKDVHNNLGKIDRNSTITIRERPIKMLKIQIPNWGENENLYHLRLNDFIDKVTTHGIEMFEKNENVQEYFGIQITTRNLYDTAIGLGNVQICLFKIEAQREYPIT